MYKQTINSIIKSIQKGKSGKLLYYPTKISIETGNLCNLKCPLCPTTNADQTGIDKGMLKFDDFKIIFDKIKPFAKTIDLFSWGEPFLNKQIAKIIAYARKESPSVRIFIDSNLNIINDEQADSIVRHKLDVLKVSCDGFTQEVYKKYRVGGDINVVLANVRKILAKKKELSSEYPKVIWKYLVFKHNIGEAAKAKELAEKMGIAFEASGMRIDCGKEIFEKVEDSITRDKEWIPEGSEYNNYSDLGHAPKICEKPWRTITINFNGDVVPCGAIYDCGKYSYGNLIMESFDEIWNNEKYVKARNIISGKCGSDPNLICSICKDNGYQYF